jgi:hypothetical protein
MSDFTWKSHDFEEFAELSGSINRQQGSVNQPERR